MNSPIKFKLCFAFVFGLASIQACSLDVARTLLSVAKASDLSYYSGRNHRWIYADNSNPEELELKQQTIKKIDKFWRAFKKDSNRLSSTKELNYQQFVVDWFGKNLKPIDKYIMWELGPGRGETQNILTLTAESHKELRPIIDTIIERAPQMKEWKFQAYKEPLPPDLIEGMLDSKGGYTLPAFKTVCKATSDNRIDVIFYAPSFKSANAQKDLECCFLVCESVLGEENLDKWLGLLETKNSQSQMKSELAATRLSKDFNLAKQQILKKLPDQFQYDLKSPENFVVIKLKTPLQPQRITMITAYPNLGKSLFSDSFYSERFSKWGEKFCYLEIDRVGEFLVSDDANKFEDCLDTSLRKSQAGCVVASGKGTNTIYLDLCLKDIEKARIIIAEICGQFKLPHTAWLYFYDVTLKNEWTGIFTDTKLPDTVG